MIKKYKRILSVILVCSMLLCINITTFASEDTISNDITYAIEIDGQIIEFAEGEKVVIPLEYIPSSTHLREVIPGPAGELIVNAAGHYFYWTIVMHTPADSFIGSVSTTDLTSGFSCGTSAITTFMGSKYVASITGHQYRASMSGVASYGGNPVAKTKFNGLIWTA